MNTSASVFDIDLSKSSDFVVFPRTQKSRLLPPSTVHTVRLALFQATRRPRPHSGVCLNTPWGSVCISGRLGQQHADTMAALLAEAEGVREEKDKILLLVDPARVKKATRQSSGDGFKTIVKELASAVVEIKSPLSLACMGHLVDTIDLARDSYGRVLVRENPNPRSRLPRLRPMWRVHLGIPLVRLIRQDIWVWRLPYQKISRLRHGASQAIARLVLSHRDQPQGGWILQRLLEVVHSPGQLRRRMMEVREDAQALAAIGVHVVGNRVFLKPPADLPPVCLLPPPTVGQDDDGAAGPT